MYMCMTLTEKYVYDVYRFERNVECINKHLALGN